MNVVRSYHNNGLFGKDLHVNVVFKNLRKLLKHVNNYELEDVYTTGTDPLAKLIFEGKVTSSQLSRLGKEAIDLIFDISKLLSNVVSESSYTGKYVKINIIFVETQNDNDVKVFLPFTKLNSIVSNEKNIEKFIIDIFNSSSHGKIGFARAIYGKDCEKYM